MNTSFFIKLNLLRYLPYVRRAGSFKRNGNLIAQDQIQEMRYGKLKTHTELTVKEWQEIREFLMKSQKTINSNNIDAVILGLLNEPQQLKLARNYVTQLRCQGIQPNAATLGRLLRTFNVNYHAQGTLTAVDETEVLNICKELRSKHEILDSMTCENLIHGYVTTTQWREALPLFDMIKVTSAPTLAAFTELILKSIKETDLELSLKLLHEMCVAGKNPKSQILLTYLNTISEQDKGNFKENLEKLFIIIEQHDLILSVDVGYAIKTIVSESFGKADITSLNSAGKCKHCEQFMKNVAIADNEFAMLSDEFMQRVLIRNDVFQKSTPQEVEKFKKFVNATVPYDCVIDGLNVAYSMGCKKSPQQLANLVAVVVKYFKKRQKNVLVLGRKHMNSWSKNTMEYIRQNAHVFLTNDLTQDDPFMLYATLKSGPTTDFFSRDLMRSHAHLLGADLKAIFRRWQQEHQYSLITHTQKGDVIVKEPIRYCISAHKVKKTWHLPLQQENVVLSPVSFEVPKNWLCCEIELNN